MTHNGVGGGQVQIDVSHRLREQRPGLKCLFMSGYSTMSDEDLPEGIELLLKSIAMGDLAAKSRQVLDA